MVNFKYILFYQKTKFKVACVNKELKNKVVCVCKF